MLRRLCTFACALSLLLCLAAAGLWVFNHEGHQPQFHLAWGDATTPPQPVLKISDGSVSFEPLMSVPPGDPARDMRSWATITERETKHLGLNHRQWIDLTLALEDE